MKNLFGKLLAMSMVMGAFNTASADEDTPLAEKMDVISSSLKGLRRAENFEEKAQLARDAQAAALASLEYLPMMFEKVTDKKELAKNTADFKRLVGLTYSKLAELEMAFIAEDEEKADKIADELKDLKKEGHTAYIEED